MNFNLREKIIKISRKVHIKNKMKNKRLKIMKVKFYQNNVEFFLIIKENTMGAYYLLNIRQITKFDINNNHYKASRYFIYLNINNQ